SGAGRAVNGASCRKLLTLGALGSTTEDARETIFVIFSSAEQGPAVGPVRAGCARVPARTLNTRRFSVQNVTKAFTTRASRRGMLKGGAALGIGALGLSSLTRHPALAQDEAALEVFSWWTSPGEAPA